MICIQFNKEELLKLLSEFYSDRLGKKIIVKESLSIKYIDGTENVNLKLFYEEEINNEKITRYLYADDICNCMENYADKNNLIFIYFKYLGGIRHIGYYVDEDTPIFEGISVNFEERNKKLVKK